MADSRETTASDGVIGSTLITADDITDWMWQLGGGVASVADVQSDINHRRSIV